MIAPQDIPVASGLNLLDPVSALVPGELVRAQNLRADAWGPRHGFTYIDRATRGRSHPLFDGATSYVTLPYISKQMDLKRNFTVDILAKITALPVGQPGWLFGINDATLRSLDVYVNTNGTVGAYLKDAAANTTTLVSTSALSVNDTFHVRVVRDKSSALLYLNTSLEDSSAELSATSVMAVVAYNRLLGDSGLAASVPFTGTIAGCYIRSMVDDDFTYAYSELPFPRGTEVLAAWTCELLDSNATVFDASTFANHGVAVNVSAGSRIAEVHEPIQALCSTTLRDGKRYNLVLVGGRLYAEVV